MLFASQTTCMSSEILQDQGPDQYAGVNISFFLFQPDLFNTVGLTTLRTAAVLRVRSVALL